MHSVGGMCNFWKLNAAEHKVSDCICISSEYMYCKASFIYSFTRTACWLQVLCCRRMHLLYGDTFYCFPDKMATKITIVTSTSHSCAFVKAKGFLSAIGTWQWCKGFIWNCSSNLIVLYTLPFEICKSPNCDTYWTWNISNWTVCRMNGRKFASIMQTCFHNMTCS